MHLRSLDGRLRTIATGLAVGIVYLVISLIVAASYSFVMRSHPATAYDWSHTWRPSSGALAALLTIVAAVVARTRYWISLAVFKATVVAMVIAFIIMASMVGADTLWDLVARLGISVGFALLIVAVWVFGQKPQWYLWRLRQMDWQPFSWAAILIGGLCLAIEVVIGITAWFLALTDVANAQIDAIYGLTPEPAPSMQWFHFLGYFAGGTLLFAGILTAFGLTMRQLENNHRPERP
jgi:hypothetical protein